MGSILLASAGSGKTYYIREKANKLEKVLIISFTNNTCDDIRDKTPNADVMTLHSFLFTIMKENSQIIEDISLLVKIFIEKYPDLKALGVFQIINIYNQASLGDFIPDFSKLKNKDLKLNQDLLCLFLDIEEEKRKSNLLTFNDIIKVFYKNINEYYDSIDEKYDHLFLDESQDFSIMQLKIIEKLIDNIFSKPNKSFTIVGDIKQSIYSFQGSSISYYEEFIGNIIKKYNPDILNRNKTYRFGGGILEFVNKIYPNHYSDKSDGNFKEIQLKKDNVINYLEDKISNDDIMILYERQNKLIERIQERFSDYGVKIKVFVEENIIYKSLMDICSIYWNKDNYSITSFYQGPFYFMKEPDLYNNKNLEIPDLSLFYDAHLFLIKLSENLTASNIDKLFFEKLILMSRHKGNLYEFLTSLPSYITLEKKGIKFSTIHSAKGLESDIVFFIKEKSLVKNLTVSYNPFYVEFKPLINKEEKENLKYVGSTRAKKDFYYIEII